VCEVKNKIRKWVLGEHADDISYDIELIYDDMVLKDLQTWAASGVSEGAVLSVVGYEEPPPSLSSESSD
jgi:hypothetical protein